MFLGKAVTNEFAEKVLVSHLERLGSSCSRCRMALVLAGCNKQPHYYVIGSEKLCNNTKGFIVDSDGYVVVTLMARV